MPDDWPKDAAQVRDECEQFPQMTWPNRDILYWVDRALAAEEALAAAPEKCGSLRVLRWVEGYMAEVVYCQRIGGPCLWPGSDYGGPKPPSEYVRLCPVGSDARA